MKKLLLATAIATPALGAYEHIAQHIALGIRSQGVNDFKVCFSVNNDADCYADEDLDPLVPLTPIADRNDKIIADVMSVMTPDLYENTTVTFDHRNGDMIKVTIERGSK